MSPDAPKKTGTRHTDKVELEIRRGGGGKGGEKLLSSPHKMLLLPATPVNKLYKPKHEESATCRNTTKPLTTIIISYSWSWLLTQLIFSYC